MDTVIIQAESKKLKALIKFLKAFNIPFELKKRGKEEEYDPAFVEKVLQAKHEKSTRIDPKNIWESIL
jgi:hypothetical protein